MGSAQLDLQPESEVLAQSSLLPDVAVDLPSAALRAQAVERLAAHRERRRQAAAAHTAATRPTPTAPVPARPARRTHVAASVAERFAKTPSYRAALAEEARRAIEQAAAEAEVALRNAEAVTAAQQQLLAELIQYETPVTFTAETAEVLTKREAAEVSAAVTSPAAAPGLRQEKPPLTVRLYEDAGLPAIGNHTHSHGNPNLSDDEARLLDEEIAFRQFPVFDDYASLVAAAKAAMLEPLTPLPANLLEFPRQLVAGKKARPRLAEGAAA